MTHAPATSRHIIRVRALEAGFDLVGVAPIAAWRDLEFARAWAEKGYGGEMGYLSNPKRADPRLILPSARSVICVGLVYNSPLPYSTEVTGTRDSGLGARNSGFGVRDSGFGTEDLSEQFQSTVPANVGNESATTTQPPGSKNRKPNPEPRAPSPEARGWISRYAWGRDYHRLMRSRLEQLRTAIESLAPGVETRVYVDTGPIIERAFARLSGVGWMGKNTCLINQQRGSWFFLGVILTSLDLEPDSLAFDRCGSCTRCLDACPTGALVEPYVMNASRCIAYLNIELKGPIPAELRPAIGANVFGCDICQDVCPWNRPLSVVRGPLPTSENRNSKLETREHRQPAGTNLPEFHPLTIGRPAASPRTFPQNAQPRGTNSEQRTTGCRQLVTSNGQRTTDDGQPTKDEGRRTGNHEPRTFSLFNPRLEDLASLTEEDFRRIFRDSPIKRAKYRGWLRNLCVVMGNSGDARFIPWLERIVRQHEDVIVREHAEWALERLQRAVGSRQTAVSKLPLSTLK